MEKSIDDSVREGPDISSPTSPITAFADNGIALIPQPSDDPEDPLVCMPLGIAFPFLKAKVTE